jgi:hypothetical protein
MGAMGAAIPMNAGHQMDLHHLYEVMQIHLVASIHRYCRTHGAHSAAIDLGGDRSVGAAEWAPWVRQYR